jgi:hypothetical protein
MAFLLSDLLAQLGQVAAIILGIYMLVNILIGLVFAVVFMFAVSWIAEKAELIKKLRPTVISVNAAIQDPESTASDGTQMSNKLVQAVHSVQSIQIPQKVENVREQAQAVEKKVDDGASSVARTVIEFRARTAQAQGVVKAFFLPGLTKRSTHRYELIEALKGEAGMPLSNGAARSRSPEAPADLIAVSTASGDEKVAQVATAGDRSGRDAFRS